MKPSLAFILTPEESFTPTASGALATVSHEISRCARARGHSPVVLARRAAVAPYADVPGVFYEQPEPPKGRLALFASRAERKLRGWTHLRHGVWMADVARLLREHDLLNVPLIIFNGPELAVRLRAQFPKANIVHWFHNQLPAKPSCIKKYKTAVNHHIACSNFTARWVETHYGLPAHTVTTLYNAVDHAHFRPGPPSLASKPVINFVGRTGMEKAPDLVLKACLELTATTTDFAVQLVGSNHWDRFELDAYQKELSDLVAALEARGITVHRPGHVDRARLPDVIRQAHIHIVPSRWDEPFGLTTLEGMACGLATVGSHTGGTPEVLGEAGLLFPKDDVPALTATLRGLLANPDHRTRVSDACRRRAEQFTWEASWKTLESVLSPLSP